MKIEQYTRIWKPNKINRTEIQNEWKRKKIKREITYTGKHAESTENWNKNNQTTIKWRETTINKQKKKLQHIWSSSRERERSELKKKTTQKSKHNKKKHTHETCQLVVCPLPGIEFIVIYFDILHPKKSPSLFIHILNVMPAQFGYIHGWTFSTVYTQRERRTKNKASKLWLDTNTGYEAINIYKRCQHNIEITSKKKPENMVWYKRITSDEWTVSMKINVFF